MALRRLSIQTFVASLVALILAACAPTPVAQIPTMMVLPSLMPSDTPIILPTASPTPTSTSSPTATFTPTETSSPSPTASNTVTDTSTPRPTRTATSSLTPSLTPSRTSKPVDRPPSRTPSATATFTPSATNPPPTPVPAFFVPPGAFQLGGHVADLNPTSADAMRRARMSWAKIQHRFSPGQDAAFVVGGWINAAHGNGFRILISIVGQPGEMGDFDAYIAAYSAFAASVAGLGADAIEVWNEPNIDREWRADMINGANYTRLLASAYAAIKARNPSTLVITGAPAPTGFFGSAGCGAGGCNDDVFMAQMANAGAANYADCIGLHYNEGVLPPSASSGDPRGAYPTYYFAGMLGRAAAFASKPLCFTELGYLSPEGYGALPGAFGWAANTSVGQQAAYLGEAVRLARGSGRVLLVIIWNVDFTSFSGDPMAGYAIIRPGGGCPACDTLAAGMS